MEAGDNIQIDVRGEMFGQAINNTFHFIVSNDGFTMEDAVTAFRGEWRANILPLVCVDYQVNKYIGAVIDGFVFNGGVTVPPNYRFGPRFTESFELAGDAALDDGDVATDPLPSYVAVSATKVCGTLTDFDENDVTLEKRLRGGVRFAGIPIVSLKTDETNELAALVLADWQAAVTAIRQIEGGGLDLIMEVVSMQKNNLPRTRIVGGLTEPFPVRGTVTSLVVSPYISSQVSRKQTVSRLG